MLRAALHSSSGAMCHVARAIPLELTMKKIALVALATLLGMATPFTIVHAQTSPADAHHPEAAQAMEPMAAPMMAGMMSKMMADHANMMMLQDGTEAHRRAGRPVDGLCRRRPQRRQESARNDAGNGACCRVAGHGCNADDLARQAGGQREDSERATRCTKDDAARGDCALCGSDARPEEESRRTGCRCQGHDVKRKSSGFTERGSLH
jgi:hypothetical protein